MTVMTKPQETTLTDRLPAVRGRYRENAPLAGVTWFRVGGPAEVVFRPADIEDLSHFLRDKPADVPVTVIGVGSNLLVRDGGVPGVVVRLGRAFANIAVEGRNITCGSACLDVNVAISAKNTGIAGLEFLSGIPGTIGGALRMNAGAYENEIKDVLIEAQALDPQGQVHTLKGDELGMAYRKSSLPCDWIFVQARLRGELGDTAVITQRMAEIHAARGGSQPIRSRTGGSTFKNPPGHKAWELIDKAGCRGLRRGAAMVSEQHCNFLINTGDATAADLEFLGEEVRTRVHQASGIRLEWEIRRIGLPNVPRHWGGGL